MVFCKEKTRPVLLTATLLLGILGLVSAEADVVELEFRQPPPSGSDTSRTLQSLVKVQGTHLFCQDGLYLMTHFGDREDIFEEENQRFVDTPYVNDTWRHCSVFSRSNGNSVMMGRNWDNQTVGSIIVSLYQPPEGYSSISFCRSIDLGFGHKDLEVYKSSTFGRKLLLAPFYATEGINEHGLGVAVAGLRQTTHSQRNGGKLVFVTFLIRKVLDQTKTIEEAITLVEEFIPFDYDKNSLHAHLIVADASGRSVILEYDQDQWRRTYADKAWQILTTKPIYDVSDADLRAGCWRYRSLSEALEKNTGADGWKTGMTMLEDVAQKGTAWSVLYSLGTKEMYFCVYQDWDTVYHIELP